MTAYDRWLEAPIQAHYAEQDAISDIVEQLLDDELNPRDPDVFMQAINEGACLDNKEFNQALKEILKNKNYDELGKLVYDFVVDYCQDTAVIRAEAIIKMRDYK
jgi:HEAT repeat protein